MAACVSRPIQGLQADAGMSKRGPAASKEKLRLFTTFDKAEDPASRVKKQDACVAAPQALLTAAASASGSWPKLSPFNAVSSHHDQPTTSLLLHCISHGHVSSSGVLPGFDLPSSTGSAEETSRSGSSSSSSAASAVDAAQTSCRGGQLAAALADHLVPGWWYLTHAVPFWRWQLQTLLEAPCFGVPGLSTYTAARTTWVRQQLLASINQDGCRQVVVLRAGFSTWTHCMARQGVKFYEVDSRQQVQAKKAALDALLPGWRKQAQRPRFVEVDFSGSLKTLVIELTGAGFDPTARCCIVMEGLLPYLSQEQVGSLAADLSALCAPGSRIIFDFLHSDVLEEGSNPPPGFASLAAAAANKGSPLRSGLKPVFSSLVKFFQPHHFRVAHLLLPHEVARLALDPQPHLTQPQPTQPQPTQPQPSPVQQQQCAAKAAAAPTAAPAPGPLAAAVSATSTILPLSGSLPYVTEFFSLASVVKMDTRLLLRHTDMAAAPAGQGGSTADAAGFASGVTAWAAAGAAAALSSPSCIVRSLAFLLWGGRLPGAMPAMAAAAATPAVAGSSATSLACLAPEGPIPSLPAATATAAATPMAVGSAGSGQHPVQQQPSGDWALAAVPGGTAMEGSTTSSSTSLAAGSTCAAWAASTSAPHAQQAAGLDRAVSISARLPADAGHMVASSSSNGGGSQGVSSVVVSERRQATAPEAAQSAAGASSGSSSSSASGPWWLPSWQFS